MLVVQVNNFFAKMRRPSPPAHSDDDHLASLCMRATAMTCMQTGEICLDILKNAWSPAWTLQSVCQVR